jgi:hypothetical protein
VFDQADFAMFLTTEDPEKKHFTTQGTTEVTFAKDQQA